MARSDDFEDLSNEEQVEKYNDDVATAHWLVKSARDALHDEDPASREGRASELLTEALAHLEESGDGAASQPRRPDGLGENVVEPRSGDLVLLRHLDDPAIFKVSTTSRYRDGDNRYGFSELNGDRTLNLRESDYVGLYDTDKSARWPKVYAEVDLMKRRRDADTGGITYHGEPLDAAEDTEDTA